MESLNALEHSILKRVSEKHPTIKSHIPFLRILNREYTGEGMYVNFIYSDEGKSLNPIEPLSDTLSTNERIELPGLKFGLCFVIDITDGKINFIELVTYGEDWDGSILNFSINDI